MRILFYLLLLPVIALAQPAKTIDATQFFARGLSAFEQPVKGVREEVNFPWVNRYEFRTETRDFDFVEQEYTFRVSPSTGKIRNAQQAYYEALRNAPDIEGQEVYCEYVSSLHQDWLSLYLLHQSIRYTNELLVILADKERVFERMAGTYDVSPEQLLKLQTEKSDAEIALYRLQLELDYLVNKYGMEGQQLVFDNFITVADVFTYLANGVPTPDSTQLLNLETAHKQELVSREIAIEAAEENQLVDFVQLKYNGPHSDLIQERLSIGLGFQLSNSGSKKLKIQELQIEQEELNLRSVRKNRERQEEMQVLQDKLQSDIQAFYYFQERMALEQEELEKISNRIAQKAGASPLLVLDIAERHLSLKLKAIKIKEDLFEDYLKCVVRSGAMCQPLRSNYLTL